MKYIEDIERLDREEKRKIKRFHERKNREQYKELLEESFRARLFTIKTKWNRYVVQIKSDPRYVNLVGQQGSTPKELFEDFINTEKENFRRQKGTLKTIIKVCSHEIIIDGENKLEQQNDLSGLRSSLR